MRVIDCEQNSTDWYQARLGIVTSSAFADAIRQPGPRGGAPKTRQKLLYTLAGERLTGQPAESYSNGYMDRGHEQEAEAIETYRFLTDNDPQPVGFVRNDGLGVGPVGTSPDRLVGDDGLVEVKTKMAHLQIELLLADRVPPEHVVQLQGQLWVTQRAWTDFVSYCPGLPLFVKRVERDDKRIAEIKVGVEEFNQELDQLVDRIQRITKAA